MLEARVQKIEDALVSLEYELSVLRKIISPSRHPDIINNALDVAYRHGLKPSPYGESFDIGRVVLLLHELGVLTQQRD